MSSSSQVLKFCTMRGDTNDVSEIRRGRGLDAVLDPLLESETDILMVCLSGVRDERKCVLLNYMTQYLTWLSGRASNSIFVRSDDLYEEGVFLWSHPFVVRMESRPGGEETQTPVLLIDVCRESEERPEICIHLSMTKLGSKVDFMQKIESMTREWDVGSKWNREREELVYLFSQWDFRDSVLKSLQWFDFYDSKADEFPVLQALVYHVLGSVCRKEKQTMEQHLVYESLSIIKSDPVVEIAMNHYVSDFLDQMSVLTHSGQRPQPLPVIHNRLAQEAGARVAAFVCSARESLIRNQLLEERLMQEYGMICERQQVHKKRTQIAVTRRVLHKYKSHMQAFVAQNPNLPNQELEDEHMKQMELCLSGCRSAGIEFDDSDLRDKMNQVLTAITARETEERAVAETVVRNQVWDYVDSYEEQMGQTLSGMMVIDWQEANHQSNRIKWNLLRALEAHLKSCGADYAARNRMKKNLSYELNNRFKIIVCQKLDALKLAKEQMEAQAKRCEALIDRHIKADPYMSRERAVHIVQDLADDASRQLPDQRFQDQLRHMMQRSLNKKWTDLQKENDDRDSRLQHLMDKLTNKYVKEMTATVSKTKVRSVTKRELNDAHEKAMDRMLRTFRKDADVVSIIASRPDLEEQLKQQMNTAFREILPEFKKHLDDRFKKLKSRTLNDYGKLMKERIDSSPPTSSDDLLAMHQELKKKVLEEAELDPLMNDLPDTQQRLLRIDRDIEEHFRQKKSGLMHAVKEREVQALMTRVYNDLCSEVEQLLEKEDEMRDTVVIRFEEMKSQAINSFRTLAGDANEQLLETIEQKLRKQMDKFCDRKVEEMEHSENPEKEDHRPVVPGKKDGKKRKATETTVMKVILDAGPPLWAEGERALTEKEISESAVEAYSMRLGRYLEVIADTGDRKEAHDAISGRILSFLEEDAVAPHVISRIRDAIAKQWKKMRDRKCKSKTGTRLVVL